MSHLSWDIDPVFFTLPYLNHPIAWYGLFFASGLLFSYLCFQKELLHLREGLKKQPKIEELRAWTDQLSWGVFIAIILGARLGEVLFYDPWTYWYHPLQVFKIWEGGLASHGAVFGLFIALYWGSLQAKRYPSLASLKLSYLRILDLISTCCGITAAFIRIGNFFNQEIIGYTTTAPWAIIFLNPRDGSPPFPRHPVQLYECLWYLAVFALLQWLWYRREIYKKPGLATGILLSTLFIGRSFIECFKLHESSWMVGSSFTMGQLLSLPFALAGFLLIRYSRKS